MFLVPSAVFVSKFHCSWIPLYIIHTCILIPVYCLVCVVTATVAAEETQLTNINGNNAVNQTAGNGATTKSNSRVASVALRDRMLYANIKTAAMLFVVSIVFIISFVPSWFVGLGVINFNPISFYIFYFNSVANPFIYAFMNRTFRDDLKLVVKRIKSRLSDW